ncbi:MAG: sporulation protein YunB [Oscillospiraceae bacterium]
MNTHHRYRLNKKQRLLVKFWIYFLIFAAISLFIDFQIRPIIKTMSAYQARVFSGKVINDAISNQLLEKNITYDKIISITLNEKGNVSSVQTDIVTLNRLRTDIINSVIESIDEISEQDIEIPIGTLTGVQLFSGRGPKVNFKIKPTGFIETSLKNKFDSAGINQTRHQIMLNINLTVTAIIPGYTTTTEVSSNFCLAETIIVGAVPEAFTEVLDSQDVTGKIFDYGADRSFTIDRTPET